MLQIFTKVVFSLNIKLDQIREYSHEYWKIYCKISLDIDNLWIVVVVFTIYEEKNSWQMAKLWLGVRNMTIFSKIIQPKYFLFCFLQCPVPLSVKIRLSLLTLLFSPCENPMCFRERQSCHFLCSLKVAICYVLPNKLEHIKCRFKTGKWYTATIPKKTSSSTTMF